MDIAIEPEAIDMRQPNRFTQKLNKSSEEIENLAGNPAQARWALYKTLCTIRDLRSEMRFLDEKMQLAQFHVECWSSNVREPLTTIETDKSNKILSAGRPSGLLTPAETAKKLGLSRSSLTLLTRDERFPQPIHVSPRKMAYIALDIEKWIQGSSS